MNSISRMNGEGDFLYTLKSENIKRKFTRSIKDVFANRMIIIKILAACTAWMCIFRGYYANIFIIFSSRAHFYLMHIGTQIIYALSSLFSVYLINNYGRKTNIYFCNLYYWCNFLEHWYFKFFK